MPDAFPSLYLDEDVSVVLSSILCARGFNALTVRDAKQLGQTDIEQLKIATKTIEFCSHIIVLTLSSCMLNVWKREKLMREL